MSHRRCWKGKTVGPASSFILCVQKNWGITAILAIWGVLVDVATCGGMDRPESVHARFIRRIRRAPVPTAPRVVAGWALIYIDCSNAVEDFRPERRGASVD